MKRLYTIAEQIPCSTVLRFFEGILILLILFQITARSHFHMENTTGAAQGKSTKQAKKLEKNEDIIQQIRSIFEVESSHYTIIDKKKLPIVYELCQKEQETLLKLIGFAAILVKREKTATPVYLVVKKFPYFAEIVRSSTTKKQKGKEVLMLCIGHTRYMKKKKLHAILYKK